MKLRIKRRQVGYVGSRVHLTFDKFRRTSMDTADIGGVLVGFECCDDTCPVKDYEGGMEAASRQQHSDQMQDGKDNVVGFGKEENYRLHCTSGSCLAAATLG